jgi:hypothetical protein
VLVHVVNGDSADPLGDFTAINQELQLFNPQLALKAQVVVVNKVDIPAVREALPGLLTMLRRAAGHSRVMGISAATGENVRELMRRVHKLVRAVERDGEGAHLKAAAGAGTGSVQGQGAAVAAAGLEQGGAAEEVVSYAEDSADRSFEVLTDDAHPGQFRVQGRHIEKVSLCHTVYVVLSSRLRVPVRGFNFSNTSSIAALTLCSADVVFLLLAFPDRWWR